MIQMSDRGLDKIEIDYTDNQVPESVKILRPLVYRNGDFICCVLGPDADAGVFGCAKTVNEALSDFDTHLQEFRSDNAHDNEVTLFIEAIYKGRENKNAGDGV